MEDTQQPDSGFTWTEDKVKEIISERDKYKAERDQALQGVQSALAVDKVYEALRTQGIEVADPYAAAKRIAGQVQPDENGDFSSSVKQWYEDTRSLFGVSDANVTPADSTPPPTATPPGLTTHSGPSPANGGAPPQPEPLTINSPEIKQAIQSEDWGQIRKWTQEGRFVPSSGAGKQQAERIRRAAPQT